MKKSLFLGLAFSIFAASSAFAAAPEINLCTGAVGKPYEQTGQMIARLNRDNPRLKLNLVTETGGTWGNVEMTFLNDPTDADFVYDAKKPGKQAAACHVMIGQPNALNRLARENRGRLQAVRQIATLNREYANVLCGRDSGIDKLQQLAKDPTKYKIGIGGRNSGARLLWEDWKQTVKGLGEISISDEGGIDAVISVASGALTCALIPAGLMDPDVATANDAYGDKLKLVPITDSDFLKPRSYDDKAPLFSEGQIPSGFYKKIQSGWFSSAVKTASWEVGVFVNMDRVKDPATLRELSTALTTARSNIIAAYGK